MAKSISTECSECGTKFRVTSASQEPVAYCPFCGDGTLLPYDDAEEELDDEEEDDLREFSDNDE